LTELNRQKEKEMHEAENRAAKNEQEALVCNPFNSSI